jgi:hypothetical protein
LLRVIVVVSSMEKVNLMFAQERAPEESVLSGGLCEMPATSDQ